MQSHFGHELFEFLLELRANNNREWFGANKGRYEQHLKEPLLAFIEDFEPYLHSISEHFVADTRANGGSMFRIYRDVRFSKDKTPYKTQAAVQFRHEAGKSVHAPGFYLHLAPGEVFAGVGLWRPDAAALGRIRERIVADQAGWEAAVTDPEFAEEFDLEGLLAEAPAQGIRSRAPAHRGPQAQGHVATCIFDEEEITQPGFIDDFADACRMASPYMEFLTQAVGLPY